MRWMIGLLGLALLAGCGAPAVSQQDAQATAFARINAGLIDSAPVVPTAAPVSLAALDLEPLLIQSGDLPAGLSGAQILDSAPQAYTSMQIPEADGFVFQRLQRGGDPAGYIVVSLYGDTVKRDATYARLLEDFQGAAKHGGATPQEVSDVGERATIVERSSYFSGAHAIFVRCQSVVDVRMAGDLVEKAEVLAYARRLDRRLQTALCP
jgi:hypothetical protein